MEHVYLVASSLRNVGQRDSSLVETAWHGDSALLFLWGYEENRSALGSGISKTQEEVHSSEFGACSFQRKQGTSGQRFGSMSNEIRSGNPLTSLHAQRSLTFKMDLEIKSLLEEIQIRMDY